ncbi:hypothetical protein Glove_197g113 [Diversispora epigaea]|uniref:AAA-ATPase-like domain-containing protein n=1 Tax=Diversispora epigaea TaxID=1348612 RepID=A0A397IKI7_9GLOM|nr:hypothetical protein Glove_197g113 [Diversispora epigaea]
MKIKGSEIQSYCKTRWGTLYTTTNFITQSKLITENHPKVITNIKVYTLLQNEEFYSNCYQIASILKPVKELTNVLEARDANLADCFIGLIKLGAKINQISFGNLWKSIIISNYNRRLGEFINRNYILAYWLHPLYRGMGLKQATLNEIYETALIMWHNLGHSEESCLKLLMEMRLWKRNVAPYNLTYDTYRETPMKWWLSINIQEDETDQLQELALLLFSIVPSQAVCERNFSMLKWFFGEKRMNLNLSKIESIAKIRSYYISNTDKEIRFRDKNLSEHELRNNINESVITYDTFEKNGILERDENIEYERNENLEENTEIENELFTSLNINQFVDLTSPAFLTTGNNLFTNNRLNTNIRSRNIVSPLSPVSPLLYISPILFFSPGKYYGKQLRKPYEEGEVSSGDKRSSEVLKPDSISSVQIKKIKSTHISEHEMPKLLKIFLTRSFADLRQEEGYYLDKTHFITKIEDLNARAILSLHPRRFGKTLFLFMLVSYYDIKNRECFEQLFGDLYIGKNITKLASSFFVLELNFSGLRTSMTYKIFEKDFH